MRPRHGVVLAGGASRRMGEDKAALVVDGATLLERQVALLRAAGLEPVVAGRAAPAGAPWRGIPDRTPGHGPLAGLASVLSALAAPVLVIAVDMPRLTVDHMTWLLAQADDGAGVVAEGEAGPEPTCAIYAPAVLPAAEALLAQGRRSLLALVAEAGVRAVTVPAELRAGLRGCNTEEEWMTFLRERERHRHQPRITPMGVNRRRGAGARRPGRARGWRPG